MPGPTPMNASSLSGCRARSVFRSAAVRSADARMAWIASELRGADADADTDAGADAGGALADCPPQAETVSEARRKDTAMRMRALSHADRREERHFAPCVTPAHAAANLRLLRNRHEGRQPEHVVTIGWRLTRAELGVALPIDLDLVTAHERGSARGRRRGRHQDVAHVTERHRRGDVLGRAVLRAEHRKHALDGSGRRGRDPRGVGKTL